LQDVSIEVLVEALKACCDSAKGLIITGYPRNMAQVSDFTRAVSIILTYE